MTKTMIQVSLRVPGFHFWPSAPNRRAYLGEVHRHLFHVSVQLEVFYDDREVEFHDLLDQVYEILSLWGSEGGYAFGGMGCEAIGRRILEGLLEIHGADRMTTVNVSEDGECGAIVFHSPDTLKEE